MCNARSAKSGIVLFDSGGDYISQYDVPKIIDEVINDKKSFNNTAGDLHTMIAFTLKIFL